MSVASKHSLSLAKSITSIYHYTTTASPHSYRILRGLRRPKKSASHELNLEFLKRENGQHSDEMGHVEGIQTVSSSQSVAPSLPKVYGISAKQKVSADSAAVKIWLSKVLQLLKDESIDYKLLVSMLRKGVDGQFTIKARDLEGILTRFYELGQYELYIYAFQHFCPSADMISSEVVLKGIELAYTLRNHDLCETIFSKFLGKVDYPLITLNIVLKNFYALTNPISAQVFLQHIWEKADDETISIAVKNIAKISQKSQDIIDLMYKYRDSKEGKISASLYRVVLESLLYLGEPELMIDVTRTIESDGLFSTPEVQEVILQQLLIEGNEGRIDAYLSLMEQQNSVLISSRPFEHAAVIFSRKQNLEGILSLVNRMDRCGVAITAPIMNAFLSALHRKDLLSKLEDNIEGWHDMGVIGTNATVNLIWKSLLRRYQDYGPIITQKMVDMKKEFPLLFEKLSSDTFQVSVSAETVSGQREVVIKPTSNAKYRTLSTLRKIQQLKQQGEIDKGELLIQELIKNNIKPEYQVFSAVLEGLCEAELSANFETVLGMMESAGYKPDSMLQLVFLLTNLKQMRKKQALSYAQRMVSVQRIRQFVYENQSNINLMMATSLGYELLYLEDYEYAVKMFNFFQRSTNDESAASNGLYTSNNHDSRSLLGLIKTKAITGNFEEINAIMKSVIDANIGADDGSRRGIVLRPAFLAQFKQTVNHAQKVCPMHLSARLDEQCLQIERNRDNWIKRDVEASLAKVKMLFDKWERGLEERASTTGRG
jgi:hypothetical protein